MPNKQKYIKALIEDKDTENIWISNFNAENITGNIDNYPLSSKYKFQEKVRIIIAKDNDYFYYKVQKL